MTVVQKTTLTVMANNIFFTIGLLLSQERLRDAGFRAYRTDSLERCDSKKS